MICALTRANRSFAASGVRAFEGSPTFYVSRESHLAWIKIAHETGIGRDAVRLIGTDGSGQMNPASLRKAIQADQAKGCVPVMVVATAGTTGAGMIDPLEECASIANDSGLWYHVDAAWGGALIVCERRSGILAGLGLADSITIDAHKWLATTMGCGMFLTPHLPVLSEAFDVSTSYMPSYIPKRDPYVMSAQWSRRFMGLRLFLSLAAAGWRGYSEHIEQAIELAAYARELLEMKGWRVLNNSPLAVLCVVPPNGRASLEAIVERVLISGDAWVSIASYEGEKVIRACVTNGETAKEDVEALVEALERACGQ
jgi:glutamate/tyrosine decarboxylase-like PLP-dependent enzyme